MEWPAAGIVPEPWCWFPVNVDPMLGASPQSLARVCQMAAGF